MKRLSRAFFTSVLLGGGLLAAGLFSLSPNAQDMSVIAEHVTVGGIDVAGKSKDEAVELIDAHVKAQGKQELTLAAGGHKVRVKAKKLGLSASSDTAAEQAVSYGQSGNLIERFMDQQDIASGKAKDFPITYTVDEAKVKRFLSKHEDDFIREVEDNGLERKDGKFVFVRGKAGTKLILDKSVENVEEYVETSFAGGDGKIKLSVDKQKPRGTKKELSVIKDTLGTFQTDYSSSSAARATNVSNGASKINGAIIYPGETFSVAKALNPMTAENGYQQAPSYENGTTVLTYGGGICQVSTTLYNAVIRAELEIVERYAHSMTVHYVPLSADAAIAGNVKDFKFKNNQDYPIYIEGYTSGGVLHFTIFGKETRKANRTVEFESETVSTVQPKSVYSANSSAALGSIVRTSGSTHTGYTARLWKIVKEDGETVSREVFNNSTYRATNATYSVGTASSNSEASAIVRSAVGSQNLSTIQSAIAKAKALISEASSSSDEKPEEKVESTREGSSSTPSATQKPASSSSSTTSSSSSDSGKKTGSSETKSEETSGEQGSSQSSGGSGDSQSSSGSAQQGSEASSGGSDKSQSEDKSSDSSSNASGSSEEENKQEDSSEPVIAQKQQGGGTGGPSGGGSAPPSEEKYIESSENSSDSGKEQPQVTEEADGEE